MPNFDPNCTLCSETPGFVASELGNMVECTCVLKNLVLSYLTPVYANSKYMSKFNPVHIEGKNVWAVSKSSETFKSMIKSYLLNTGMRLKHQTTTPFEIINCFLGSGNDMERWRTDVLVILMGSDPPNKMYGTLLQNLIESRIRLGVQTLIHTKIPITSPGFVDTYSKSLSEFIRENFQRVDA